MLNPRFELLVKKSDVVHYAIGDTYETMRKWLEKYNELGVSSILIDRMEKKGVAAGPKVDWSKYTKVVKVTFGDKKEYHYYTSCHWEVGDARVINTSRGIRWGVVCCAPVYVSLYDICVIEYEEGELDCLEDQVLGDPVEEE